MSAQHQADLGVVKESSSSFGAAANLARVPHAMCNLVVHQVTLGKEVSFTIPKGMSGKMLLELIEKAHPRTEGDGVVSPDTRLLGDSGINELVAQDTKYTIVICDNSNNRTRSEQAAYLKENNLSFSDSWIVMVAAALYRDAHGFPSKRTDIGTAKDAGDLFQGRVARAASGALSFDGGGLYVDHFSDDFRDKKVVSAGSSSRIKKIDR